MSPKVNDPLQFPSYKLYYNVVFYVVQSYHCNKFISPNVQSNCYNKIIG